MDATKIVEHCSAGLMLRGVIYGLDINDPLYEHNVTLKKLVEIQSQPSLSGPTRTQSREQKELYSVAELNIYTNSINSTASSVEAKIGVQGNKLGAGWKKKKVNKQANNLQDQTIFYSKVFSRIVAVKSIQFVKENLRLSEEVKDALKNIQKQIQDRRRDLFKTISDFFEEFGSHINAGLYHLGGMLTWTSTFDSRKDSSMDEVQSLVSTVLDATAGIEYCGIGASVSALKMKQKGKIDGEFEHNVLANTHVNWQQYGGIAITGDYTEDNWVEGLPNESEKWVVVRAERQKSDYIGVWDLLPKEGFDDKGELRDTLQTFYKTYLYRNHIYRIMSSAEDDLESIRDALNNMKDITEERDVENGVQKEWQQLLLDDKTVAQFLLTPNKHLLHARTEVLNDISTAIEQLLGYVGGTKFMDKEKVHQMQEDICRRTNKR